MAKSSSQSCWRIDNGRNCGCRDVSVSFASLYVLTYVPVGISQPAPSRCPRSCQHNPKHVFSHMHVGVVMGTSHDVIQKNRIFLSVKDQRLLTNCTSKKPFVNLSVTAYLLVPVVDCTKKNKEPANYIHRV